MPKVVAVLPALNEEKYITKVINDVKNIVDEVIVVCDGSEDNTAEKAREVGAIVLEHLVNRGQGAALRTGTEFALDSGADIIVHYDSDGQFIPDDIKRVINPILEGDAEIVFGSRNMSITDNQPFTKRYFIRPIAKVINWAITGLWMTDVHNGFRAMNSWAASQITITQDGYAHATEIIAAVSDAKLKWKEVPVTVVYHEYGQRWWQGIRILADLFIRKISR